MDGVTQTHTFILMGSGTKGLRVRRVRGKPCCNIYRGREDLLLGKCYFAHSIDQTDRRNSRIASLTSRAPSSLHATYQQKTTPQATTNKLNPITTPRHKNDHKATPLNQKNTKQTPKHTQEPTPEAFFSGIKRKQILSHEQKEKTSPSTIKSPPQTTQKPSLTDYSVTS